MVMVNVSLKLTRRIMMIMNKKMILKEDYKMNFKRQKRDSDKKQGNLRRRRRQIRHFDKISNDLKFNILSYLPPKSLFKFRCVSKEFRCIIDDPLLALEHSRRLAAKSIPFTGFVIRINRDGMFTDGGHQLSFISMNNTDGGGLPDSSLSFLKEDQLEDDVKLIDSCNGLLLCKIIDRTTTYSRNQKGKLFVCNPLTMQRVFVPHPRIHRSHRPFYEYFALIAKSMLMGYLRYKIVYICDIQTKLEDKEYSKLWIFSSETGVWEEFHYRLPALCFGSIMDRRTRIFVKGTTLIWDCFASGKYILVCYLNSKSSPESSSSKCFELIESPCQYHYVRCLWDYNGKILFYFHQRYVDLYNKDNGKLSAWSLYFGDNDKIEWKNENSLQLKTLADDIWKHDNRHEYLGREFLPHMQIVGYNPSLKTMYVLMDSVLLSYELEDRRFELVWESNCGRYKPSVAFKYIHSLEPIEIGRTKTDISTSIDDETEYDDNDDPILREDDIVPQWYI